MNYFVSPNFLIVEVVINPSGGNTMTKNPIQQQQQLDNRKIIAIETWAAQDVNYSPISSNNAIIANTIFFNSFLTLYRAAVPGVQEGLYYDNMPLPMLRRTINQAIATTPVNSSTQDLFRMRPAEISWTKSYISIPNSQALGAVQSVILGVHYLDQGAANTEVEKYAQH